MFGNLVDIFNSDLFTSTSLTYAINLHSVAPSRISDLGIFKESGINTTSAIIERRGTSLIIVPNSARGAPPARMRSQKAAAVSIAAPHLNVADQLQADELQNVRQFGSTDQMVGVEQKRDEKLADMSMSLDNTLEYHRLGALQGIVLDADGETPILDVFDTFNVDQADPFFFNLSADQDPTAPGSIRSTAFRIKNAIRTGLNNQPFRGSVWAPCGDAFWEALIDNPQVRATYLNQAAANDFREQDVASETLALGGILFEHYPGFGAVAIPTDECLFVPLGIPDLFVTKFAPADWFSAVNTIGLPKYLMASLDNTGQKSIDLESQSNPINICTRPEILFTGNRNAS